MAYCRANDTAFLVHVAAWLVKHQGVDERLVFATGFSAGAMMVERLGCDAPGPFAALAPVEGDLMDNSTCAPAPTKRVPWYATSEPYHACGPDASVQLRLVQPATKTRVQHHTPHVPFQQVSCTGSQEPSHSLTHLLQCCLPPHRTLQARILRFDRLRMPGGMLPFELLCFFGRHRTSVTRCWHARSNLANEPIVQPSILRTLFVSPPCISTRPGNATVCFPLPAVCFVFGGHLALFEM